MANYDYEIVNGRKIRVRPKETVSEIDKNGYFRRQPNHFTTPFGDGENDLKAEGNKRYRLVWAKLCHWSNRAAIVRELEGLEDQISVNMVEHAPHEKNLGWEYVYNENNIDPVLGDQFLSEAYYRADDDYQGRTTVPALIDTTTGKVVNNDYNWLATYFEVNFRPWHKKGAPELYPVELREEIDKMNLWLFDNINNAVYRSSFSRSNEGHFDGVNTFYAAMDRLEKRLETNRFLFGDYVTDSDIRLYVTLARLDIRYTAQLSETKHPLYTYKNLWGYAKELWEIPAFKNNTFFADFAVPPADAREELRERKTASAPAHTTIWHFRRLTGMHSGRFRPSAPTCPQTRPIRSILETTADSTSTRPGTIWAQNLRKKRRKKRRRPADAAAADQIIDKK